MNKTKYLFIGETHSNLKLDKNSEIESCQEYKYLGVIFDTSGTDDKEIRSRVIQARKCIACLNGILWSKGIRKERKLNIYNVLINPLNPELNPICYLLALIGAHHFLRVSRIRVKLLTFRLLMLFIYGAPILDVSISHTTTQHRR